MSQQSPLYCHLKSRQNKRIFLVTPMIRPGFSSPPRSSHDRRTPRVSLHLLSLQNGEISQVFFSNMSFCYLLLDLDTQRRIETKQSLTTHGWFLSSTHFAWKTFLILRAGNKWKYLLKSKFPAVGVSDPPEKDAFIKITLEGCEWQNIGHKWLYSRLNRSPMMKVWINLWLSVLMKCLAQIAKCLIILVIWKRYHKQKTKVK